MSRPFFFRNEYSENSKLILADTYCHFKQVAISVLVI